MLRTMVWPFCVAGCLAGAEMEDRFRAKGRSLQPRSIFGTVHKALEIMESVWLQRDGEGKMDCTLAQCFGSGGQLILLV